MCGCDLNQSLMTWRTAKLLLLGAALTSGAQPALPAQSQSSPDTISVPMFFEMQLQAEDVPALLGPQLGAVLSLVSIEARGSGRAILSSGGPITDGELIEAEAFFDITYRIDFQDTDPENDYDPQFRTGPQNISLRLPRGQSSRIEGSGMCVADASSPNFGCVPQIIGFSNPDISWRRDNTLALGAGASLTLPDTNLASAFTEQIPVAGNAIFTDGFESGDVSAWTVDSGAPGTSSLQPRTASSFSVAAAGSLEIQEKVVVPGSALTNLFSLIGEGSTASLGFQTTMIFTNTGGPSDLQIEFFSPAGEPMAVSLAGLPPNPAQSAPMTAFSTTLSSGQALSLQTAGQENLQVGYARFTAGPSVGATAVFTRSDTPTGAVLYDAGVPAISRPLRSFSIFLDSLGNKDTGLAMVRTGQSAGAMTQGAADNVRLRLFDTDFNPVAATSLFLPQGAQVSRFIWEYFQDQPEVAAQAREMQGVVVVESEDLLAAITLRLTDDPENPTLTAFPVIEGRAEPSMMEAFQKGSGRRP